MRRWARKFARPLAVLFVVAQLMSYVPPAAAHSSSAQDSSHSCPCCPDGARSMADCLASCTMTAFLAPSFTLPMVETMPAFAAASVAPPVQYLSDPPIKPPPIA